MNQLTDRATAFKDPQNHIFIGQIGYIRINDKLVAGTQATSQCNPPMPITDQSWHFLLPPGGSDPVSFQWFVKSRSWVRHDARSNRLGYSPEYLSSHGWKYLIDAAGLHDAKRS